MSNNGVSGIQYQSNYSVQDNTYDISSRETEGQEKSEQLFQTYELDRDTYEKDESLKVLNCENYPNYQNQIKIGMPKGVFVDSFGYEMQRNIEKYMKEFYAGKVSEEDVKKYFEDCCKSMLIYRTQHCQTSGQDVEDNQKIISQIFEVFCKGNQRAARNTNHLEGQKINNSYQTGNDYDFIYYNADYYYQCEEMREVFRNMAGKMTDEWGIPAINLEEVEKNTIYTLDGALDFNSGWNFMYRNNFSIGSIEKEEMIPPKDFVFFYKESPNPTSKDINVQSTGILSVKCGSYKKTIDVPYRISHYGLRGHIFNLSELVKLSKEHTEQDNEYNEFLNNFTVFTRMYSYHTGINNKFGNHVPRYL